MISVRFSFILEVDQVDILKPVLVFEKVLNSLLSVLFRDGHIYTIVSKTMAFEFYSVVYVSPVADIPNEQYFGVLVALPVNHGPIVTDP